MLLRFAASNYLSLADRQELSLVKSRLKGPEEGLLAVPGVALQAVPSAIVYGANASGKSNLIKALIFMRNAVLQSHARGNPEGGVPRIPFALDPECKTSPTVLEADFVIGETRYEYGFECDDDRFLSEWLYSYPEGKRRRLFEREQNDVVFGSFLKGPKKLLVELMRPNSLFLSTATQNDHEGLSEVAAFFRSFKVISTISVANEMINHTFKRGNLDIRTIAFLKAIGTGIVSFRQKEMEVSETQKAMQRDFMEVVRRHLGDTPNIDDDPQEPDSKNILIEFAHEGVDGTEYFLGPERESSGTRRLLVMLRNIFQALDKGSLVIVDELDASLHTHAAEQIVRLFFDATINQHGAQMIATTHDTNLLNCGALRRDQVWFCEKDDRGATQLFPLSDIKSRQSDDFETGYLEGRYGAIPFSGDLRHLLAEALA